MANVFVNEESLSDIADAIRSKLNVQTTYKPGEMAAAIESISGGGSTINNQNKTVHPSSSQQSITADSGYTGLGTVTVKGVTVENLTASNIVSGVTVKIGDADDDDSIASVTGTASSGGITPTGTKQISITQNGTTTEDVTNYANAEIAVNVSGGGSTGLVYETGTFTPSENIARAEISFANSHDKPPMMLMMVDATNDGTDGFIENTNYLFLYMDYWRAFGTTYPASSTTLAYAEVIYKSKSTANPSYAGYPFTTANSDNTTDNAAPYSRYWVSYDKFHPYCNNASRYWRSGRTYKWYAVWKPTT